MDILPENKGDQVSEIPAQPTHAPAVVAASKRNPAFKVLFIIAVLLVLGLVTVFGLKELKKRSDQQDLTQASKVYVAFAKNVKQKQYERAHSKFSSSFKKELPVAGLKATMKYTPWLDIVKPGVHLKIVKKEKIKTAGKPDVIHLTVAYSKKSDVLNNLTAAMEEEGGNWFIDKIDIKGEFTK